MAMATSMYWVPQMAVIRIAWYKNNGDLSFEEIVVSNTTDQPNSVYAYDMDGDGLLDVLAASLSAGDTMVSQ
jgi:hypothetical protein